MNREQDECVIWKSKKVKNLSLNEINLTRHSAVLENILHLINLINGHVHTVKFQVWQLLLNTGWMNRLNYSLVWTEVTLEIAMIDTILMSRMFNIK